MGLMGTWRNELGSKLVIKQITDDTLIGTYESAVSEDSCAQGEFALTGRTDVELGGDTVGFAVTWRNDQSDCNATTSWAGQYLDANGEESLTTLWLLVSKTDSGQQWASTIVGKDVFTREGASPEQPNESAIPTPQPYP